MFYQGIIDAIPAETALMDRNGTIFAVNTIWREKAATGCNSTLYMECGMNYIELLKMMNRTDDLYHVHEVLNGLKESYQYTYVSHDIPAKLFVFSVKPIIENGTIQGAILAHEEYDRLQAALPEKKPAPSMPFFLLNDNWTFSYVNSEAEILLQYPGHFLAGKKITDFFPHFFEEASSSHYEQAMTEKKPVTLYDYVSNTGNSYHICLFPYYKGGLAVFFQPTGTERQIGERVERFAFFDHLTGIGNRRMISVQLLEREQTKQPFTLFCLNIDQFKHFNEVYGYERGDEALVYLAKKLDEAVADSHDLARIGADEFALFIPEALPAPEIIRMAHDLLKTASGPIPLKDLPAVVLKVNIGVVSSADQTVTAASALDQANMAVKKAKLSPFSSFELFKKDIQDELIRLRQIEHDLRHIEIGSEFFLVFQPQVDASTEEIIGFECLSRWNHPVYGFISPAEFIHIAEEKLFIYSLTEKIIDYVFNVLKGWKTTYAFSGIISINLSSFLLEHERFIDFVQAKLNEYAIDPAQIEFEITESVQLFSSENVNSHLRKLRDAGIRISIDDFGTGYAALSYLSNFPVDKLKIDKHFVDQIELDDNGEAVLETIILMAEKLNLQYIAEGVETAEQLAFLTKHGCSHIQGYYFYKPLPEKDCQFLLNA